MLKMNIKLIFKANMKGSHLLYRLMIKMSLRFALKRIRNYGLIGYN